MSRDALLEAATEEFARYGLHGARVHAIVRRARVNERMIYHHFDSKEGLYQAVLAAQWAAVAETWQPALDEASALAPREGLELALGVLAEVLHSRPAFLRLVFHEAMNGWERAPAATIDEVPAALRALHRRGVREGVFRRDVTFELFYVTAMGALAFEPVMRTRFSDLRTGGAGPRPGAQIVALVLDGLLTSRSPAKRKKGRR